MSTVPRSLLFTPGNRPDRFAKAASSAVDAVILDLEDAVAEGDKGAARAHVMAYCNSPERARVQIIVRINPLTSVWGLEDLAGLAKLKLGPDVLLVPKVEHGAQIAAVAAVLENVGAAASVAALIESALGVVNAAQVARSHKRLAFLMFGAADYAADLGQRVDSFDPQFARGSLVNAAASAGIVAIDSPFFAIDQSDELRAECQSARALGFHGKAAIHPSQLATINDSFAPTANEREHAARILQAAPEGVGVLDGKMVDIAMVRWARRIA